MLAESKQLLVDMGYPEIISRLFYEKFGKNAVIVARWFKQANAFGINSERPDWWYTALSNFRKPSIADYTRLYSSTSDPESYKKAAEWLGLDTDDEIIDDDYLQSQREALGEQIEQAFEKHTFFRAYSLIEDLASGKLKDLAGYKKLNFQAAQHRYDEKNIYEKMKPIKTYEDGFKWVDIGSKCQLLGSQMSNCGSVGTMSMDPNATIIALFGPTNKPHVMVTYSPGEKRISGDQGAGYTPVKDKYHSYIIDLADTMGARFDADKSKSQLMRLKYLLRGKLQSIQELDPGAAFGSNYRIVLGGGTYYTNGYTVVSDADVHRVQDMLKKGVITLHHQGKDMVASVLATANSPDLARHGVTYTSIDQLAA